MSKICGISPKRKLCNAGLATQIMGPKTLHTSMSSSCMISHTVGGQTCLFGQIEKALFQTQKNLFFDLDALLLEGGLPPPPFFCAGGSQNKKTTAKHECLRGRFRLLSCFFLHLLATAMLQNHVPWGGCCSMTLTHRKSPWWTWTPLLPSSPFQERGCLLTPRP